MDYNKQKVTYVIEWAAKDGRSKSGARRLTYQRITTNDSMVRIESLQDVIDYAEHLTGGVDFKIFQEVKHTHQGVA